MWTFPPRKILVAVDFGDASAHALRIGGELARTFGAQLTAFHAESFDAPPYFTHEQLTAIEQQRRAARHEAARYLARFAEPLTRHPVEALVVEAPPAAGILEAAHDRDLIVMGTHGRRGPVRWWAGSVAERVARDAAGPVLVVRADASGAAELFDRIAVVARDGAFDGSARRYARGLAAAFGGKPPTESAESIRGAALQDATLVTLAQAGGPGSGVQSAAVEQTLKSCHRPVLFVPSI
jgi:nucleotide-binding universal stress UspA family protein